MNSTPNSMFKPLLERANALTDANTIEGRSVTQPPTVAAQSPLHELLICEIAATIPPAIAQRLRQAKSVSPVHDWIAAGAMFNWVKADSALGQKFIEELGECPKNAALALARTIARTLDPPPPDARAPFLDKVGLFWEVIVATAILSVRACFLYFLVAMFCDARPSLDFTTIARQLWIPDILAAAFSSLTLQALATMSAASWLMLECRFVPKVLEFVRGLPLLELSKRGHKHWRPDALHSVWALHAFIVQCALTWHCIGAGYAARVSLYDNSIVAAFVVVCLVVALMVIVPVAIRLLLPDKD